jgi:DHA1 family bicyclomycin/chloramphenicol resistance-like MFS transporter
MARYFQADYAIVQLAVSLYLVATGVLQLLIGPASDRFGRRPVLLVCFLIFLAGTVAATFAPTIEILLACRLLQAFSAAGMVISRAIIRDTVDAALAASRIGYVTMGMTIIPMVGPVIGGLLDEHFGWQATFWFTFAFGLVSFLLVFADLGETNRNRMSSLSKQLQAYPALLSSKRFWGYTMTAALTSGSFFAFIGGAPYVASDMLGMSPSEYGLYFAIISIGYLVGNYITTRVSRRIGIDSMMLAGNVFCLLGAIIPATLFLIGYAHPLSLFAPAALIGIGNGFALPNAMAGLVSVQPKLSGSASGLGGAMQLTGGAIMTVLAGAWLTLESGPYPLFLVMSVCAVVAIGTAAWSLSVSRREGAL